MTTTKDPLVVARDQLEKTIKEDWHSDNAGRLDHALADTEQAIRQHGDLAGRAGEPVVEIDRPLLPSPGADRRKAHLRDELAGLLRETRALRNEVQAGISSPTLAPDQTCLGSNAELSGSRKEFDQRARQLAEKLAQFTREEANFVQETVTTDIGAGD